MVDERKKQGNAAGEEDSSGFTVTDKRKFSGQGEPRVESAAEKDEPARTAAPGPGPAAEKSEGKTAGGHGEYDDPAADSTMMEVNFSNFILSLGTSAVLHFGEFPDPTTGKQEQNLPMAKHTIDILNMLRDKTTGNLESGEEKLLSDLLYQLRMKYVSLT